VTFASPALLLLLPALLVAAIVLAMTRRRGAALLVADPGLVGLAARRTWRLRLRWVPTAVRWLAIALIIVALARPRQGLAVTTIPEEGIDVVVTVDVSSSMTTSLGPFATRISAARTVVGDFVKSLEGDRVGLVIFQSRALTLSPLTLDQAAIEQRISTLKPGLLPDGTAIGLGVTEALGLLRDSPAKSRVIVLLTDGENNAGEIDPLVAAQLAKALGVRIYTIGFTGGVPGSVDSTALRRMAEPTGGKYFDASTQADLAAAYRQIGDLERSRVGERRFTSFRELAAPLIAGALGLLTLEIVLRSTWLRRYP
jgi:Ca-activated chloride channel family protein